MINNTAIVFIIFDGYEDLWDDAIRLIQKNWKNHPPIYVFTNEIVKQWEGVKCIPVGKDAEWSMKAQKAIEYVNEKYFILLLEDFYVGSPVMDKKVGDLIDFMENNKIYYCKLCDNNRLVQKVKPKFRHSSFDGIFADEEYGICLQASVWEKEFFAKIVGDGNYNAWVFELNQVKKERTAQHKLLPYAIEDRRNILNIKHGALQGKMLPTTIRYFNKIGDPLRTNREVMSYYDFFKVNMKFLGRGIVPHFAAKRVKRIAKLFGYSFVEEKWTK